MKTAHIVQDDADEHVFVMIECSGRPPISLDIMNRHGRRGLGVRVDGMGIFDVLLDIRELSPQGHAMHRFCGMCGEKIQLHSSRSHQCKAG